MTLPRVHDDEAEMFVRQLFAEMPFSDFDLMRGALRQYFYQDRVRYFITSAVGFYVGSLDTPHMDDYMNVATLGDGTFAIRGQINPINVVEPLQWLGARIADK